MTQLSARVRALEAKQRRKQHENSSYSICAHNYTGECLNRDGECFCGFADGEPPRYEISFDIAGANPDKPSRFHRSPVTEDDQR
jgi:hypothetical protein